MEVKFAAMIGTADDKYTRLVDYICQMKNKSDVDYDKIFKLIKSIHEDEIAIIMRLYEAELMTYKPELQLPSFMTDKRA